MSFEQAPRNVYDELLKAAELRQKEQRKDAEADREAVYGDCISLSEHRKTNHELTMGLCALNAKKFGPEGAMDI